MRAPRRITRARSDRSSIAMSAHSTVGEDVDVGLDQVGEAVQVGRPARRSEGGPGRERIVGRAHGEVGLDRRPPRDLREQLAPS